jgi:hypothetical protein
MDNKEGKDLNSTQFRSALQYLAAIVAAYVAGRGWLPKETASELANWIVVGIPILLAIWQSRDKGRLQEAAKVKDENGDRVKIVASDDLANSIPRDNVIPASQVNIVPKDQDK